MTAILCWINRECNNEMLWAAADSRISNPNQNSGVSPLTDNCPKLFSIPILAGDKHESPKQQLYTVGFAYAGSTLIGLATKEIVARILGNLIESNFVDKLGNLVKAETIPVPFKIPSLLEVANLVSKIGGRYLMEMGQYYTNLAIAEFSVFGYCLRSASYLAYKITRQSHNNCAFEVSRIQILNGEILQLGDNQKIIKDRIAAIRSKLDNNLSEWHRAPIKALSEAINEKEQSSSIGGYTQITICTPVGITEFQMFKEKDQKPSFFGFDIENDLGSLGGFVIDLPGMVN